MSGKCVIRLIMFLSVAVSNQTLGPLYAQWLWQYPLPQGNTLWTGWAFGTNEVAFAGGAGTFMATSNAGASWEVAHYIGNSNISRIEDLHFVNSTLGFAVTSSISKCNT